MPIETAAIAVLTEDGQMSPEVAIAIAKSIDLSISGANLVTMPAFNERFAELNTKLEARFSRLEGSIASAKVWAVGLYAALAMAIFGALAADHHWLVGRQDELLDRLDRRFEQVDQRFQQMDQRFQKVEERFQQMDQRFQKVEERLQHMDQRFEHVDQQLQQIEQHFAEVDRRLTTASRGPRHQR